MGLSGEQSSGRVVKVGVAKNANAIGNSQCELDPSSGEAERNQSNWHRLAWTGGERGSHVAAEGRRRTHALGLGLRMRMETFEHRVR